MAFDYSNCDEYSNVKWLKMSGIIVPCKKYTSWKYTLTNFRDQTY